MIHKISDCFAHLPMFWEFVIPLAVIGLFCAVLFWEGLYGHANRIIKNMRGSQPVDKSN